MGELEAGCWKKSASSFSAEKEIFTISFRRRGDSRSLTSTEPDDGEAIFEGVMLILAMSRLFPKLLL